MSFNFVCVHIYWYMYALECLFYLGSFASWLVKTRFEKEKYILCLFLCILRSSLLDLCLYLCTCPFLCILFLFLWLLRCPWVLFFHCDLYLHSKMFVVSTCWMLLLLCSTPLLLSSWCFMLVIVLLAAASVVVVVLLFHWGELRTAIFTDSGRACPLSRSNLLSSNSHCENVSSKLFMSNVGSSSFVRYPIDVVPTGIENLLHSCR